MANKSLPPGWGNRNPSAKPDWESQKKEKAKQESQDIPTSNNIEKIESPIKPKEISEVPTAEISEQTVYTETTESTESIEDIESIENTENTESTDSNRFDTHIQANTDSARGRSSKKSILIGMGAGLGVCAVFAFWLFCVLHLMNNRDDLPDSKSDKVAEASISEESTESESKEAVTTAVTTTENIEEEETKDPSEDENESSGNLVDAYSEIINMFYRNISTGWADYDLDDWTYGISYMWYDYGVINNLSLTGYQLLDINGDGIDELIVGEISDYNGRVSIYDIYTMYDNNVIHLAQKHERDFLDITANQEICISGSGGASYSSKTYYHIEQGKLEPIEAYKYDGFEDENNPYFYSNDPMIISYSYNYYEFQTWKQISADEYHSDGHGTLELNLTLFSEYNSDGISEETEVNTSQSSFSTDINDYPLYLARLQQLANLVNDEEYLDVFEAQGFSDLYWHNGYWGDGYSNISSYGYVLRDLNSDGIPDLFIMNDYGVIYEMYTLYNHRTIQLCLSVLGNAYELCENNLIYRSEGFGDMGHGWSLHTYNGGDALEEIWNIESYVYSPTTGEVWYDGPHYYLDGSRISQSEAENIIDSYSAAMCVITPLSTVLQ